jgi:hypothetical protein
MPFALAFAFAFTVFGWHDGELETVVAGSKNGSGRLENLWWQARGLVVVSSAVDSSGLERQLIATGLVAGLGAGSKISSDESRARRWFGRKTV